MEMQYVNGASFEYFNVLHDDMYIGYLLNHYLHQHEYLYDFYYCDYYNNCYLQQQLGSAIKPQWFISTFDHLGYASNK